MSFAAPLFLIATLAAAIPIVLHMINRQKARELPFATLRFLHVSVEKTRRRKRVHDVLLLAIRVAALGLIALGLAKPTLSRLGTAWDGADTAVVIVLDNSASMGMTDQGEVRFRTALRAAEQIIDQLHQGDQVALLPTGGPVAAEPPRWDRTHEETRQMLLEWIDAPSQTGGVSYQRADLALKIRQARTLLATSGATNRQVYVLSDLQGLSWENTAVGRTAADESQASADGTDEDSSPAEEETAPPDVPIIVVDCGRAPEPNVALGGVSLASAVPVTGLPVAVRVALLNASTVARQPRVELYVDGLHQQSSPTLAIAPGNRLTYEFTFTPTGAGLHRGEVRLTGDDGSPLDDRLFFALEVDRGIPVAVVKPRRHEIAYLEDTFYIEQALAPGRSGAWAIRTTALSADELPTEPLGDYKVVFCVNLPAAEGEVLERLRAYVAGGGNLVWICGDNVDPAAYNAMNKRAGGELLPAPLTAVRTAGTDPGADETADGSTDEDRDEVRDSWQIGFFDAEHPALKRLAEPAALYQSVLVYRHVDMEEDGSSGAWVMARLDDGRPLLVQRHVERGTVVMLGTGAHVDWSNLPLRQVFLPLLVRLTYYLAGVEQDRHTLLAGSPLVLPLEGAAEPSAVELILPDGAMIRRQTVDPEGRPLEAFRYDDTHEIGIYRLRLLGAGGQRELAYAVNVDPDEADPEKIPREDLAELLAPMPVVFAEDPRDLSATFALLREGKSLWEPLLAGVLLVLVFESLLANRLSPKQEPPSKSVP